MKKIIFDLCGTLYYSNTTFEFISYLSGKDNKRKIVHEIINSTLMRLFFRIVKKVTKIDLYRKCSLLLLSGYKREYLLDIAQQYYDKALKHKAIVDVHSLLFSFLDVSDVYVISATLDVIAEVVCKNIDNRIKFISSQLKYSNGVCSGYIQYDLLGNKHKIWDESIDVCVSDNFSDIILLQRSQMPIVITNKNDLLWWKRQSFSITPRIIIK